MNSVDSTSAEAQSSILSSLEPERASNRLGIKAALLCLMAGMLGTALYWANAPRLHSSSWAMANWLSMAGKPASNSSIPPAEKTEAKAKLVTTPVVAPNAPAIIVAEAMPPAEELLPHSADLAASATPENHTGQAAHDNAKDDASAAPQNQKAPLASKENPGLASETQIAEAKPAAREAKPAAKAAHHHAPGTAAKTKPGKDQDVEIIAALLAKTNPQSNGAASKPGAMAARHGSKSGGAKTDKQIDPKRDVVVRAGGESTEVLVKRCQALGFFEGELCRFRICSGRWGNDPGCPSNAPTFNTTQAN